ncbi:MAG TPA: 2-succinyl-5-enolpyruvyl-6-hydroxy-3-cyclohexene-1-carboxylic-acid synthase [Streptosporangiaceae bacterium]|nr:2-succinyl-5-enolpyruvyl-6-hydroxy-3-cyclohexene-1-carboxylic-acid synthase [Streptosporangiaceae bacterium]
MNPSTAFGLTFTDELIRCGLREVVLAPGSRSTPLAMAFLDAEGQHQIRLHVRIDERSASFTALGLAKASRRPVAVLCTSGTAAANFHPAVIEADESGIPLLVLTADRPPEMRGTGANQVIDQVKLYGSAVRWFCDAGVPEMRPGMAGYWRSLACQAWAHASGQAGALAGPVHLNLAFREPLVPGEPGDPGEPDWPEPLEGRPDGRPWTSFERPGPAPDELEVPWAERGVVVCGDGDYDAAALVALAEQAGWPVLAEPSSGARRGPNALSAYQYLLATPEFMTAHQPDLIVSAGRPGLSRPQAALLATGPGRRHVVIAQGPGRWADPQRAATDVARAIRLTAAPDLPGGAGESGGAGDSGGAGESAGADESGSTRESGWLGDWRRADHAARAATDAALDDDETLTEPRLARDLARHVPEGALFWTGSSLPVRDIDFHLSPRDDLRILASRGASGIDGTTSAAIGAALAHGGPAFALIGDLTFLHDAPGLAIGPGEPRPDLCLIVVNNDGGGIFSTLEQAAFPGSFERIFGTPHGARLHQLAAAFGLPYQLLEQPSDLTKALQGTGLRMVEAQTDRAAGAALRARLREVARQAVRASQAR